MRYNMFGFTEPQNTNIILSGCSQLGIAAYMCDTLTFGGYNDWFLPSFNELLDDEITQFSVNMDPYITIFIGIIVTIGVGIIINLIQII